MSSRRPAQCLTSPAIFPTPVVVGPSIPGIVGNAGGFGGNPDEIGSSSAMVTFVFFCFLSLLRYQLILLYTQGLIYFSKKQVGFPSWGH